MQLPKDKFINDVSAALMDLRTNLTELATKSGINRQNFDQFQRTISDFTESMTLEDHNNIENVVIEIESLALDKQLPLALVDNMFINALEEEIDAARKRAGERTTVRTSKLKEARELIIHGMNEYVPGNVESHENLIEAVQEAVNLTRAKLGELLSDNEVKFAQISFALNGGNRHGSTYLELIYALNNILREYKEAEMN